MMHFPVRALTTSGQHRATRAFCHRLATRAQTQRCWRCSAADVHAQTPGAPISRTDLFLAGWPDEGRTDPYAAKNRLQVTLSKLRKAGLGDALQRFGSGYRLDPDLDVKRE